MKKVLLTVTVIILAAVFALSANAASIANHLFDKQGGIDAGGQTWSVYGWIVTDAEITSVGYILDNGDINSYKAVVTGVENDTRESAQTKSGVSDAYRDLALEDAVKNGGMSAGVSWDILRAYRIQIVIDLSGLEEGKHTVLLCAKFTDGTFSDAFRTQSEFKFTKAASGEEVIGGKGASTQFLIDSDTSSDSKIEMTGWAGSTVETSKLGYRIDDGETLFNDNYVKLIPLDILEPGDAAVMDAAGVYAFRFKVSFPLSEMPEGDHYIKLVMIDEDGGETIVGSGGGNEELMFYYDTDDIETTAVTTEAVTETESVTETETATETEAKTETEPAAETGTEAVTETEEVTEETAEGTETKESSETEAETAEQGGDTTAEAVTTGEQSGNGKGLPAGAIIAIIAAAAVVIAVIAVILVKKKK